MKTTNTQAGFTMIELLITLTVTVVGLMGVLAMNVALGKGNRGASRSSEALTIGQETVEDLRAMSQPAIATAYGNNPVDADMADVVGRANQTFRRHLTITDVNSALMLIKVEVGWSDDGAAEGADNGTYDHAVSFEIVRAQNETL